MRDIPLIDLFAGPGGLNEGFSKAGTDFGVAFQTALSIEMDEVACRTLRLRAVRRKIKGQEALEGYFEYIKDARDLASFLSIPEVERAFSQASEEVLQLEMGPENRGVSREAIRAALGDRADGDWILIGGPPCQAYSLAGRSRRANDKSFYEDKKHFLYREYLAILQDSAPALFVMENVKGLLSSTHSDISMFDRIMEDLTHPRAGLEYEILSLAVKKAGDLRPSDFVLQAEHYGVPQKRHRVILVGVRRDLIDRGFDLPQLLEASRVTVGDAISDLPQLRSGISPVVKDSDEAWAKLRESSALRAGEEVGTHALTRGARFVRSTGRIADTSEYGRWVHSPELQGAIQHETRAHMESDLARYFHAAAWGKKYDSSPRLRDLPTDLLPLHKNATSERHPFDDRFRVQVTSQPASTVVSHISKDGHYYIHPDPGQMRSLTVREAARLQSFPDDYFFEGNRTQQYHQVGNAVPPLLAWKIGNALAEGISHLRDVP